MISRCCNLKHMCSFQKRKKKVCSVNELEVNVGWKNKHFSCINIHVGTHNCVLVLI